MAESEYSPTVAFTPPRSIGTLHSLTLITPLVAGIALIADSAQASCQPQSHAIMRVDDPADRTPSPISAFTSAITSPGGRLPQRGQPAPPKCDQQLVRFSEAEIVNTPAKSGTRRIIEATPSRR